MAKENPALDERAEEDAIRSAIADTEEEIFNAGVGSEDLEKDGDRSLEQMEDPLGGVPQAEQEASESDDDGDAEEPEAEAEGEAEPRRDERDVRTVPSTRLREEADARRQAEQEAAAWRARYDELQRSARPQQPQQPPPPEPDMFADPEGYKQHFKQQFRQELALASLHEARARYGEEFDYAYRLIDSDPRFAREAEQVKASFNPGEALMRVAEPYMAEFREQRSQRELEQAQEVASRNGYELVPVQAGRPSSNRPQQQHRPIPPSLNGASGSGGSRQRLDPRGMDGSEGAIFADAFTPLR